MLVFACCKPGMFPQSEILALRPVQLQTLHTALAPCVGEHLAIITTANLQVNTYLRSASVPPLMFVRTEGGITVSNSCMAVVLAREPRTGESACKQRTSFQVCSKRCKTTHNGPAVEHGRKLLHVAIISQQVHHSVQKNKKEMKT